ncbi:LpqB family beta-propeller domain-containing protein [Rothia sp. ZJ1223]|uniref:LpqB family beta-propeller domain-containing protein n=1 Tax=Rothia sp. ZJ1223 TaxID=2811098 RepID=UPI00195A4505|nr:LpqB family beta-propeller domain-containing protein [Rothia sp. ZJ1223]MBM7050848.1 GerMN domain-containing protein [Rothia sp. ZJ1223]
MAAYRLTGCLAATGILTLTACGGIPTSGAVNHYADPRSTASASRQSSEIEGPATNATPDEIIRGFISAGVGVNDNYAVARQFLAPDYAQQWSPQEQTLVYTNTPSISATDKGDYTLAVELTAKIDARGIATSFDTADGENLSFQLENIGGQWRITSAPNSIILDQRQFNIAYNPFTLYFYDPTFSYAVPDVRWFADRDTVATSVVRVLLEGPAPYLQGAVQTAIPTGTTLTRSSVPVESSVASVDLSGAGVQKELTQLESQRIKTQLTQTLSTLSTVSSVELKVAGQTIQEDDARADSLPLINPPVSGGVVGVEENTLITRSSLSDVASQNTVLAPQQQTVTSPAMAISRGVYAYLANNEKELWLVRNGEARQLLAASDITVPSFDYLHWVWAVQNGSQVMVSLSTSDGNQPQEVAADWLEGYTVTSLNISRDGTRAVIAAHDDTYSYTWVAGVIRDGEGAPQRLQTPVRLGTGISPTFADFLSDNEVIIADYNTGATEIISISGVRRSPEILTGLAKISVGTGEENVIAQTQDSTLYRLSSSGWVRLENTLHDLNFSG